MRFCYNVQVIVCFLILLSSCTSNSGIDISGQTDTPEHSYIININDYTYNPMEFETQDIVVKYNKDGIEDISELEIPNAGIIRSATFNIGETPSQDYCTNKKVDLSKFNNSLEITPEFYNISSTLENNSIKLVVNTSKFPNVKEAFTPNCMSAVIYQLGLKLNLGDNVVSVKSVEFGSDKNTFPVTLKNTPSLKQYELTTVNNNKILKLQRIDFKHYPYMRISLSGSIPSPINDEVQDLDNTKECNKYLCTKEAIIDQQLVQTDTSVTKELNRLQVTDREYVIDDIINIKSFLLYTWTKKYNTVQQQESLDINNYYFQWKSSKTKYNHSLVGAISCSECFIKVFYNPKYYPVEIDSNATMISKVFVSYNGNALQKLEQNQWRFITKESKKFLYIYGVGTASSLKIKYYYSTRSN